MNRLVFCVFVIAMLECFKYGFL